jgi:hypothetical protein
MDYKTFSALRVKDLRLDSLARLGSETVAIVGRYPAILSPTAQIALGILDAHSTALDSVIHRPTKNAKTAPIAVKDRLRDNQLAEIKRNVKANLKSTLDFKVDAAQQLDLFLTPFGHIGKLNIPDQTHELHNLQAHYIAPENAALRNAASVLGIAELFDDLFVANDELNVLHQERMREQAVQSPAASAIKVNVVKSYEMFCIAVQQDLNLTPSKDLLAMFGELEKLRTFYVAILNRKTSSANGAEADTEIGAEAGAEAGAETAAATGADIAATGDTAAAASAEQ